MSDAFITPKRDRWGRYLLPDPDTGIECAWQRVTTLVKIPADTFALERWKMRRVAKGLAQRPDLLARAAAADIDDRKDLDDVVSAAIEAAEGSAAANMGTAIHRIVERLCRGEDPDVPADLRSTVDAWRRVTDAAGITFDAALVERIVVNTDLVVAGTLDAIATLPDGTRVVADIKTGTSVEYGAGEWAAQLAAYARARGLWNGGTGLDAWDPMPAGLDVTRGLIVHLPAGAGECHLFWVDLEAGWTWARRAAAIREMRKQARSWIAPATDLARAVEPAPVDTAERKAELLARLRSLPGELRARARAEWPEGVPGFKTPHDHTDAELDAIEAMIERLCGDPVDDGTIADFTARLKALPPDLALAVEADVKPRGVPHLGAGVLSAHDAAVLEGALAAAENEAAERHMQRIRAIDTLDDDAVAPVLEAAAVSPELAEDRRLDDLGHERLMAVIEAVERGDLSVVDGALVADEALIDRAGGKRQLNLAARAAADGHGIEVPTSAAKVLADPLLVALAAREINHNQHQETAA